jgi:hypothetical protein
MSTIAESAHALNNEVPDAKTRTRRGGRSPRRKGNGFEREVVAALQKLALAAERVPLSGSVKTSKFDHDISCPVRGVDRRLECKRRKRSFHTISKMLAGNFALIVRDDNSPPLVIMSIPTFAELARQPVVRDCPANPFPAHGAGRSPSVATTKQRES